MSTLTSRGAAAVKIYEEAVQCRSAAAAIQSSPKTSGVVFTSGSCTRSQKHTMKHNNLNYFTHFPLICQHSLPQTGEDSLSTFFLICNLNQLCRTSLSKTGIFLKIWHVTAASCCWNIKYTEQLRSTSMFPAVSMCEEWCVKPTSSCVWTVTLIMVGTVSDLFTRSVSAVDCRDGQHVSASSHCTKMNLRSLSDRVCAVLIRRWSHSMEVLCTHSIKNRPATTNLPQ